MSKSNGQVDVRPDMQDEEQKQGMEHELPPAEPNDGFVEEGAKQQNAATAQAAAESELQKVKAERDNLLDRLARLQAEFDNYRKRSMKENADFRDYAVADTARSLLPVIDNFGLAIRNAESHPQDFRKGVELIHKQLQDVLQKMNVQRVPAEGQPFDPRVHEAIEMVESNDVPDNHVLQELQPGYKIKDRLLRPAMVRVAKSTK
jgi:molecular chaperone GrpE